jgi:hypothetical protein
VKFHGEWCRHGECDGGQSAVRVIAGHAGDDASTEPVGARGHRGGDGDGVVARVRPDVKFAARRARLQLDAVGIHQ